MPKTNQQARRKEPNDDYYRSRFSPPRIKKLLRLNTDTGEYQEKRLAHPKEADEFYCSLASVGQAVRIGMEASVHGQWFERLLEGLGVELWRGDAEVIRAKRGRKEKTDREDARHILKLLVKDDFPRSGYRTGRTAICGNYCGTV